MKILIDIGHPAHVHLFRNFAQIMLDRGNDVLFTCREKEFEIDLLKHYNFRYVSFGKKYKSMIGKMWGLAKFDCSELAACHQFHPDILLSHGSLYAAFAARMIHKPHISFEDTFNMEQVRLYEPNTDVILTGNYPHPRISDKEIHYSGYHELAYLHPNRFKPDNSILEELGVSADEKYVILRFVAWNASHDAGHKGIAYQDKLDAIKEFSKYAKVFISSEAKLPDQLEKYRIKIPSYRMLDALAYSTLLWGESFTMPSECSVLGVPSVITHNNTSYYLDEQQKKYDLCYHYSESLEDQRSAIQKCLELLQRKNLNEEWQEKRQRLLSDKIDVTDSKLGVPESLFSKTTEEMK